MVSGGKESETYECEYGYVIGHCPNTNFWAGATVRLAPNAMQCNAMQYGLLSSASLVKRDNISKRDGALFSQITLLDLILPIPWHSSLPMIIYNPI